MHTMKKKKVLKKIDREKEGYTIQEMRILTNKYIDEMVERLRKRLREVRKEKAAQRRRVRHEITV